MKRIFFILYALIPLCVQSQNLFLVDPLEPIYPDKNDLSGYSNVYTLDFPSNSIADVHVLLRAPKGSTVTPSASYNDATIPVKYWSILGAVPVDQNTGLESRTEQFDNKRNPYVIRRAPFQVFDIIKPLGNISSQTTDNFTAWRLSIPTSYFKGPGNYKVAIRVDGAPGVSTATFNVRIHNVAVPKLNSSHFYFSNWFNLGKMEATHRLTRGTPAWYSMLDKYAALMASCRQNAIIIPHQFITVSNGKIILDEEKMLNYINIFKKYGFQYFEGPPIMYWGKIVATQHQNNTEQGRREIDTITRLIYNFVAKNKLTSNWLQHIYDEPNKGQIALYQSAANQLKSNFPNVKIIEATSLTNDLTGLLKYWCPHVNDFSDNISFYNQRIKNGDKVLVYTSLGPGGPWLNRTLDEERLREVYFGWGAALYNTSGFLHWGLNEYSGNPMTQTIVLNATRGAKSNNYLPAGDSHIVYPVQDGPLSSIRFEAHRVGAEDYELLSIMKGNNQSSASQLINKIFRSYTDYNKDVKSYRAARTQLLESLN